MAISLGSIVVELLANTVGFTSGMDKASYQARKTTKEIHQSFHEMGDRIGDSITEALGQFGQVGQVLSSLGSKFSELGSAFDKGGNALAAAATAIGAMGAAAIGAGIGLAELAKQGGELVESFDRVSQKTGINIRDLQIFEAAGSTVGVGLDDLVAAMRRFDQALLNTGKGSNAQAIMKELGVTSKDNKEALYQLADAFAKMDDGPRKASDAVALFGKSGLSMIPLLNKGRDGIKEFADMVDRYGPKIGKDAVEANERYEKSVTQLGLQWQKFKVDVEQSVLPVLAKLGNALDFQAIKAGLAGGVGGAKILQEQQKANAAATEEIRKQSAAKDDSLLKQEQINAKLQQMFETQRAGGTAAYALEQARLNLQGAVENGLWKQASAIQSQIPALEEAARIEAVRIENAKKLSESYKALEKFFAAGAVVRPALPDKPIVPNTDLWKTGPANPLEGAPDLGEPKFLKDAEIIPELLKPALDRAKPMLDAFYDDWNRQSHGTIESINADYDKQLAQFQGLLALGEISQKQFNDVSLKLETERQAGLKRLREDTGTSTWADAWSDMFKRIEDSGRDFARNITASIGGAIDSMTHQMAEFLATGKGLNFKQIGDELKTNIFESVLKKGESSLFGSLGNALGLGDLFGGKRDGSSVSNALFVTFAGAGPGGVGSLPLGNFPDFGSLLPSLSGNDNSPFGGVGKLASGIGHGLGGLFGGIASLFGGFLADGGDAQPGKAYIVGERRPELFVPKSAGTVIPAVPGGDSNIINMGGFHVHGVVDADSFKKGQAQTMAQLGRAIGAAQGRARR